MTLNLLFKRWGKEPIPLTFLANGKKIDLLGPQRGECPVQVDIEPQDSLMELEFRGNFLGMALSGLMLQDSVD